MKVTFFTAPGHAFNFAMTLSHMQDNFAFPLPDFEKIEEVNPNALEYKAMQHFSKGEEVVIDGNPLVKGMEGLAYMPHEYLTRLHMVVEPPEQEPEVVDYFVGRAIDLVSTPPESRLLRLNDFNRKLF